MGVERLGWIAQVGRVFRTKDERKNITHIIFRLIDLIDL